MTDVKLTTIKENEPLPDIKLYFVDFGLTITESEVNDKSTGGTKLYIHPTALFSGGIKAHKSNDVYALCISFFDIESQ